MPPCCPTCHLPQMPHQSQIPKPASRQAISSEVSTPMHHHQHWLPLVSVQAKHMTACLTSCPPSCLHRRLHLLEAQVFLEYFIMTESALRGVTIRIDILCTNLLHRSIVESAEVTSALLKFTLAHTRIGQSRQSPRALPE